MRRAILLGLLLAVMGATGVLPAAPTDADAGLIIRWPAKADAEDPYFEAGYFLSLSPAPVVGDGPYSVSVWVNATDLAGGDATYGRGIARSARGEQVGDWFLSVHRDGRVRFCNWRTAGDDKQGSHVTRKPVVATDEWVHLTATWDGKTNRVFVNGVEAAHDPGSTAAGWGTGHEVGRCWTDPGYHWDGMIDDLRVYRRALSAEEIVQAAKDRPALTVTREVHPAGDAKVSEAIDRIVLAKLKEHGLTPAPRADDAEFLRRVMLDLIGRIPTPRETEAFLADESPDKRRRLTESLLAGREMPMYWSGVLSGWLMPKEGQRDPQFLGYLRRGLARNKPWDRLAREMLIARPTGPRDQAASLFLGYRKESLKDNTIARDVGRAFFGVDLRCAQCHNHPTVPEWTLERFYGLSAFFARTYEHAYTDAQGQKQTAWGERTSGNLEYTTEGKKRIASLVFLDGREVPEPPLPADFKEPPPSQEAPAFSRREALARVALTAEARFFTQPVVNRVWHRLLGRGLVEPVERMFEGTPGTHPELLALLADDLGSHGFDLRRLLAVIVQSETYGRSSRWPGMGDLPEETLYAVAVLKPLDAEQMALSLPLATGYYDPQLAGPPKRTVAQVRSVTVWQEVLTEFEQETEEFEPTTSQALFLLNSDYVQTNFLTRSNLVQALSGLGEAEAIARRAYLAVLSRRPSAEETSLVRHHLDDRGPEARAEACRELVWALLSGAEFRFNH